MIMLQGKQFGGAAVATQAFNPIYTREASETTSPSLVYYGISSPQIFRAIREIQEIAALPEDWDMERGAAVTEAAISLATTVVLAASKHGHRAPDVYPLNDGGILLEWRGMTFFGQDLLLQTECLASGSFEMSISSEECTYEFSADFDAVTEFNISSGFARLSAPELPA